MKKLVLCLMPLLLLAGCSAAEDDIPVAASCVPSSVTEATAISSETIPLQDPIRRILNTMTMEERVGQLFLIRCNKATALEDIAAYHPGGMILFADSFQDETPPSIRMLTANYQSHSKIPLLLAVDEEGGSVNRISQFPAFRDTAFPSARNAYEKGGIDFVTALEEEKCQLLKSLGLNVNVGPVCDITDRSKAFLYSRTLCADPVEAGACVSRMVAIKNAYQIGSALKHFPGYGSNEDTHTGIAADHRPMSAFVDSDLIPFREGIRAGAGCILISHLIADAFDSQWPASLSPEIHRFIRDEMGFSGVLLTDDLVMEAIRRQYGTGEAAVLAVLAGNDLLCSTEYAIQYQAVLNAALEGRIDIDVLNNAVRHVLQWKIDLGLIDPTQY